MVKDWRALESLFVQILLGPPFPLGGSRAAPSAMRVLGPSLSDRVGQRATFFREQWEARWYSFYGCLPEGLLFCTLSLRERPEQVAQEPEDHLLLLQKGWSPEPDLKTVVGRTRPHKRQPL